MPNSISVEKSKKSAVKRLKMLPRVTLTVDVVGYQFTFAHAPLSETLLNLIGKGFTLTNFLKVSLQQLSETQPAANEAAPRKKPRKSK